MKSAQCERDDHSWCANRNYEECNCSCVCHKKSTTEQSLRAENEQLKVICANANRDQQLAMQLEAENASLKAELERVTKERDEAMAMSRLCFSSSSAARAEVGRIREDRAEVVLDRDRFNAECAGLEAELTQLREVADAARRVSEAYKIYETATLSDLDDLGIRNRLTDEIIGSKRALRNALSRLDKEKANECCSGCPDCKGIIWTGVGD